MQITPAERQELVDLIRDAVRAELDAREQWQQRADKAAQTVYSQKQAAQFLGVHLNTVYLYMKRGYLRAARHGRRVVIHRDDLEKFARRNTPSANLRPFPAQRKAS